MSPLPLLDAHTDLDHHIFHHHDPQFGVDIDHDHDSNPEVYILTVILTLTLILTLPLFHTQTLL